MLRTYVKHSVHAGPCCAAAAAPGARKPRRVRKAWEFYAEELLARALAQVHG